MSTLLKALSGLGDSALGSGLGVAAILLVIMVPVVVFRWDGHLHDRKGCVELQEVRGVVYKVDTCTGETEILEDPIKKEKTPAQQAPDEPTEIPKDR